MSSPSSPAVSEPGPTSIHFNGDGQAETPPNPAISPPLNPLSAPYSPNGRATPTALAATFQALSVSPQPAEPDAQILEALRSAKDRLFVLKLGEAMEALINDQ